MERENPFTEEKVKDHCAIVGIFAPERDVVGLVGTALTQLNHRGHEGSGVAVHDSNGLIHMFKQSGWARDVFTDVNVIFLQNMEPTVAVGQNRYSTSGTEDAWQPFEHQNRAGVHNGNITNALQLLQLLPEKLQGNVVNDTDIVVKAIGSATGNNQQEILSRIFGQVEGAANFIIMADNKLYAYRDFKGIRPLSIAMLQDKEDLPRGYVIASETCVYGPLNATYFRDISPGEGLMVDEHGIHTFFVDRRLDKSKLAQCMFELIYISAPDSNIFGKSVYEVRFNIGRALAEEDITEGFLPDVIVPVQHSGIPYAEGYATAYIEAVIRNPEHFGIKPEHVPTLAAGLQSKTGLIVNQYSPGRAFISSDHRDAVNRLKHRGNDVVLAGRNVVVMDDSLVRGDAQKHITQLLQQAGVKGTHVRVGCPPIKHPCFLGVDTPDPDKLAWNKYGKTVDGVLKEIHADSLRYIAPKRLLEVVIGNELFGNMTDEEFYEIAGYCGSCFLREEARYPFDVSGVFRKKS